VSEPQRTVLIVDDEAPLRRVLERALEREGYRVLGAGSAETAYELLTAGPRCFSPSSTAGLRWRGGSPS